MLLPTTKSRENLLPIRLGALISLLVFSGVSTIAGPRTLRDVVYDYAVTSYCGLLTAEVERGFRRELVQITARAGLSSEDAKAARIAGWVAADREWSNRGLGGFRAWCKTDGMAAAKHFKSIVRGTPGER